MLFDIESKVSRGNEVLDVNYSFMTANDNTRYTWLKLLSLQFSIFVLTNRAKNLEITKKTFNIRKTVWTRCNFCVIKVWRARDLIFSLRCNELTVLKTRHEKHWELREIYSLVLYCSLATILRSIEQVPTLPALCERYAHLEFLSSIKKSATSKLRYRIVTENLSTQTSRKCSNVKFYILFYLIINVYNIIDSNLVIKVCKSEKI